MSSSVSVPVLVTVAAVAVGFVAFTATNLWRQVRLRHHLRRLRMPLESGRK